MVDGRIITLRAVFYWCIPAGNFVLSTGATSVALACSDLWLIYTADCRTTWLSYSDDMYG